MDSLKPPHPLVLGTMNWGNFGQWGGFEWSDSFVKGATVPIQKSLFIASTFMEINDWFLG